MTATARQAAVPAWLPEDHATWCRLFGRQAECRSKLAHPLFSAGLEALGIGPDRIPDLNDVNDRLSRRTGWRGVTVEGLEGPKSFFALLARREFPIGAFLRDAKDLNYTPAPDIFHDLYGHMPFFVDPDYARFCEAFGSAALAVAEDPARLREFERLFWFGVEFPLVRTPKGRRIFGGGILSSFGESLYAMSASPEVRRFDVQEVRRREFRIDQMQPTLYELESPDELYRCLDDW